MHHGNLSKAEGATKANLRIKAMKNQRNNVKPLYHPGTSIAKGKKEIKKRTPNKKNIARKRHSGSDGRSCERERLGGVDESQRQKTTEGGN